MEDDALVLCMSILQLDKIHELAVQIGEKVAKAEDLGLYISNRNSQDFYITINWVSILGTSSVYPALPRPMSM